MILVVPRPQSAARRVVSARLRTPTAAAASGTAPRRCWSKPLADLGVGRAGRAFCESVLLWTPRTASAEGRRQSPPQPKKNGRQLPPERHFCMAYATARSLVSLFGADRNHTRFRTGRARANSTKRSFRRAGAGITSGRLSRGSLCDAAFGGLSSIPPRVVVSILGTSPGTGSPGGDIREHRPITERYTKALNWLRDVADGKAGIPRPAACGNGNAGGRVARTRYARPWMG